MFGKTSIKHPFLGHWSVRSDLFHTCNFDHVIPGLLLRAGYVEVHHAQISEG